MKRIRSGIRAAAGFLLRLSAPSPPPDLSNAGSNSRSVLRPYVTRRLSPKEKTMDAWVGSRCVEA